MPSAATACRNSSRMATGPGSARKGRRSECRRAAAAANSMVRWSAWARPPSRSLASRSAGPPGLCDTVADHPAAAKPSRARHSAPPQESTRPRPSGSIAGSDRDRSAYSSRVSPVSTHRQVTISCGAALLFARVALAAAGVAHHVELMPNHDDFDLLARILLAGDQEAGPDETLLARTIPRRSTVRGIFDERRVPARLRDRLAADAASEGAWLRWIDSPPERAVTALLVTRAAPRDG